MTTAERERAFLPAMGKDWLLPLYDPFTRALGTPAEHRRLAEQAELRPGHRVLEIGCGTANLALLVKRAYPDTVVAGLDPDPRALARAERKARRAGLSVRFDRGFAAELPYEDGSFDRVLSAFMFHHLEADERRSMLRQVRRVLAAGGSLHLVDFSGGSSHSHGPIARRARQSPRLADNDRIPELMWDAGLVDPVATAHRKRFFGELTFYRAGR